MLDCIPEPEFMPLVAWSVSSRRLGEYGLHIDGCPRCAGQVRAAMVRATELGLDPAPPLVFDDFELLRPLGRGTTGRLYLARDTQLGRLVALKFLITDGLGEATRARLSTEARALARLQHPNVVAVFRIGEVAGRGYLAYEYVAGRSLERAGPMAWPEVLGIGLGMARGLAAAHQRGVLHRDLKPGNVLRSGDGEVKLVDFGLAKLSEDDEAGPEPVLVRDVEDLALTLPMDASPIATAHTGRGQVVGTPLYMPPEAWRGEPAAAPRDVYGLGLVLYELLVGQLPHAGLPLVEMYHHVIGEDVPRLAPQCPGVPAGLAALIDQCLRRDPRARPTIDDLEAGLVTLVGMAAYAGRRTGAPLAESDAARISASMATLGSPGALVAEFYGRLFAAHPYLRPLFPFDMEGQQAKLAAALHLVVANLHRPEALSVTLADLGRRHQGYGATRGHYACVRGALLGALAHALGPAFDPPTADAWGRALDLLIAAMTDHLE
jgi:hemoglobin-like flavoprotein/predicted Ser/Thr protein kinase